MMTVDWSVVTISATKPRGKPALMLAEMGIRITAIEEDEGNVDRYILSKALAVERRTGSSLVRGIMDKTLFTSAIYLREHFRVPILIVEGEVNYEHTAFDPQAVRGALSSMMLLYAVSVLSTPNLDETVRLIAMMARQEQLGIPGISLIPKRKAADLPDMQRRAFEMLPGCGMVLARQLLQHFGSVRRIVNATADELRLVRGLGARKAADIAKVVSAEYQAVDTERDLEDAIEAEPSLLFSQPVTLLARQHHMFTEMGKRHAVDLVFLDPHSNQVILVELKRGKVSRDSYQQLRRYMDHARESRLLRPYITEGAEVCGILATVEESAYRPKAADVSVSIIDKGRVIDVLKRLRRQRLQRLADPDR